MGYLYMTMKIIYSYNKLSSNDNLTQYYLLTWFLKRPNGKESSEEQTQTDRFSNLPMAQEWQDVCFQAEPNSETAPQHEPYLHILHILEFRYFQFVQSLNIHLHIQIFYVLKYTKVVRLFLIFINQ